MSFERSIMLAVQQHLATNLPPYPIGLEETPRLADDTLEFPYLIVYGSTDGDTEEVNQFSGHGQIETMPQVSIRADSSASLDIVLGNVRQVMTNKRPPTIPVTYYNPDTSIDRVEQVDVIRQTHVTQFKDRSDDGRVWTAAYSCRWLTNARG